MMEFKEGEPWKIFYGPVFIYLNSVSQKEESSTLHSGAMPKTRWLEKLQVGLMNLYHQRITRRVINVDPLRVSCWCRTDTMIIILHYLEDLHGLSWLLLANLNHGKWKPRAISFGLKRVMMEVSQSKGCKRELTAYMHGFLVFLGTENKPTFWRIIKKKSAYGFHSIPYSEALFSAMLYLYYAFLKDSNRTMLITINSFGCVVETTYLIIYMIYATKQAKIHTGWLLILFNGAVYGLIILFTMLLCNAKQCLSAVGWICGAFSLCVFAAPLSIMRLVIRTKSVEFMPFGLSFTLTLCAVIWFFYGFLIKDFFIAVAICDRRRH